jgi:tetratricopeptide (TPR) repeat protein
MLAALIEATNAPAGTPAPTPGHHVWEIIKTVFLLSLIIGFTIWVFIQAFRRSEEPVLLGLKWLLTMGMAALTWFMVAPIVKRGGYEAMVAMLFIMACGWCFAFIWRRNLATMFAQPFADLYTGGSREVDPTPFYSIANTKRKRGFYREAVIEIRKELEKFPNDFEGQLLLADIQAENLNDLPGAAVTIQRICNQDHAPRNVALALNYLADWHLKFNQDRDAAREALEKIIELLPDSEMSALASQRIGHLGSTEHLLSRHDPKKIALVEGVKNLGLLDPKFHPKPAEEGAAKEAADLVAHLHSHPLDTEARERLAVIYANQYKRLDLATDQLEQLIASPNQPPKRVVHWLNVLADLQIRNDLDYESVRATLERIIELFPKTAAADVAASRITHLKLELKAKEQKPTIKLGNYEQDIGLKNRLRG